MRLQGRLLRSYSSCIDLCRSKAQTVTGLPGHASTCHTQVRHAAVVACTHICVAAAHKSRSTAGGVWRPFRADTCMLALPARSSACF